MKASSDRKVSLTLLLVLTACSFGRQIADDGYRYAIDRPHHAHDTGPVVAVDAGHDREGAAPGAEQNAASS